MSTHNYVEDYTNMPLDVAGLPLNFVTRVAPVLTLF